MAKGAYIGVEGVARKIKKGYIGVGGVARKIKKAYIGVGGVARPFWSGGEPAYYGTTTALSVATSRLAATSNKNYAIFAGGISSASVDAYDKSLVKTTPSGLSADRREMAATGIGDYALFGGGDSGGTSTSILEAYDSQLTRSTVGYMHDYEHGGSGGAATTTGNYAIFAGGRPGSAAVAYTTAYDTNLVCTLPSNLSQNKTYLAATTVGNYALFGGGYSISSSNRWTIRNTVDAYNSDLVKTTPTALATGTAYLSAATAGGYALFAGGGTDTSISDGGQKYNYVTSYDTNLAQGTPTSLSVARWHPAAVTLGNYAIFAGGSVSDYAGSAVVESYSADLTRTIRDNLSQARSSFASAAIGDYALFGGGSDRPLTQSGGGSTYNTVDVYTLA